MLSYVIFTNLNSYGYGQLSALLTTGRSTDKCHIPSNPPAGCSQVALDIRVRSWQLVLLPPVGKFFYCRNSRSISWLVNAQRKLMVHKPSRRPAISGGWYVMRGVGWPVIIYLKWRFVKSLRVAFDINVTYCLHDYLLIKGTDENVGEYMWIVKVLV